MGGLLMATTELEEVQALLDRVRPDPTAFAQRLLVQVMARFGDVPEPDPTVFYTVDDPDERDAPPPITVPASHTGTIDTNMLLATALGACECWGLQAECPVCAGEGRSGWLLPDHELFEELIRPAVVRMTGGTPGHDSGHRPSAKGVD